ncbi:MAG TPA: hypothetical protein VMT19_08110 [Thermoanaerobaculaceae bacterium]|nr:hypothetical protein [Thermoanaerobaculaceae bacterium]
MRNRIVFVVAAALALVAAGAVAQTSPPASGAPPVAAAVPQGGEAATLGAGLVVFIDPATGKFRGPEPGEMEALVGTRALRPLEVRPLEVKVGPGGAVGMVLDSSFETFMVVTRQPDGKLTMQCVTGEANATAAVAPRAGAATPSVAGKEVPHVH